MAKIEWVFQNEQGTNLNRYKAINVSTGEEIVFDLLRNANISIVGTPLNAEKLNGLINAINSLSKSDVGLENVDNTSDANKSVKYATSSGSATNDSSGNNISTTYQKKTWTRVFNQLVDGTEVVNVSIDFSNYNEILFIVGGTQTPGTYNFPTDYVTNETLSLYDGVGNTHSGAGFYFTSKRLTMIEHYATSSERIIIYAR